MTTKIDDLVNRFLTWPVPADVYPDGTPGQPGRTGTNLLTAQQAKDMLTHVLGDVLAEAAKSERLRDQLHLAEVVRASQVEGLTQGAAGWRERANQLEAEVAKLREDAERWRHVINPRAEGPGLFFLDDDGNVSDALLGAHAVAAVDAARKGTT